MIYIPALQTHILLKKVPNNGTKDECDEFVIKLKQTNTGRTYVIIN